MFKSNSRNGENTLFINILFIFYFLFFSIISWSGERREGRQAFIRYRSRKEEIAAGLMDSLNKTHI